MKTNKATSVEEYKIVSSFQTLKKTLLEEKFRDRLEKPLAYWALPNDRRLPLAFLGRTIKDLLDTPFEELSATPGIGQKKIGSLVKLLSRATKEQPSAASSVDAAAEAPQPTVVSANPGDFDPTVVSEALWASWRESVTRHGLDDEKLGRLAPTLQALPTVIWNTPLGTYANYTLAEIRQLKTHGEKRVRVVLEIFHTAHTVVGGAGSSGHLSIRLVPKFTGPIDAWVSQMMERHGAPSVEETKSALAIPLLEQIKLDAGDAIYQLATDRLGVYGESESVRNQAKRLEITRARVYQLLDECANVMRVRWPEGERRLAGLLAKAQAEAAPEDDLHLLRSTIELFYPGKNRLEDEDGGDDATDSQEGSGI